MSALQEAVERFARTYRDTDEGGVVQGEARTVVPLIHDADASERVAALPVLAGLLADDPHADDPRFGGLAAILAGVFVDHGTPPDALAILLLKRLPDVLAVASRFADSLDAGLPPLEKGEETGEGDDDSEDEERSGIPYGDRFVPSGILDPVIAREERGFHAFSGLGWWCMPTIACLSLSADLRQRVRADYATLLPLSRRLEPVSGEAGCLRKLLQVMDDAAFLVLHPSTGQGFHCRVSGVSDNFQLHTLLADALLDDGSGSPNRIASRERPDPITVAVARGDGPQELGEPGSRGFWNLYQWFALEEEGTLPDGNGLSNAARSATWIWNEGIPSDIESVDGYHVVLLGPASYTRAWNTARFFGNLKASVVVESVLTPSETADWLARLAKEAAAQRDVYVSEYEKAFGAS